MEEGETVSLLSRKELRKQKLMEFLAAKGKLKQPNPKPYPQHEYQVNKPLASAKKVVMGKENKAPVDRANVESREVPILAAQSTIHSARKVFGVSNKVNVKRNVLTGLQNAHFPSLPKHNQNPVFPRKCPAPKANLKAASNVKTQPNAGIKSSNRVSSNASNRFSSGLNAAWSCPTKAESVRMSFGPLVKTKTGLIPAVTQPRNGQSQNLTHTSATVVDTSTDSVANKARPSTLASVSVFKGSALAQRKTLHNTALNIPVTQRATVSFTARAGIKVQNKSNSKLNVAKHSLPSNKSQLSGGLKTFTSTKCTTASIKTVGRVEMPKKNTQPTDTKQRFKGEGKKIVQQCKVASHTYSGPVSRCSSKAESRVTPTAVAQLESKSKTCKETDGKKGQRSSNAQPPQTRVRRPSVPVMSQTVPRPARTIGHTGRAKDMKTTKIPARVVPQTEGKKQTVAQEERMKRLQEWRDAKGISYKRPPMPVKPLVRRTVAVHQPFWATMKEEDEVHSLICAVDRSLADCIKLLGEGCPADQVKAVLSRLPPVSQKFAKYWICQARLMEQEGNMDVLPMFEQAVGVVLEPVDELRTVVFEILKRKDEIQAAKGNEDEEERVPAGECTPENIGNPMMTPKPVRALICGEKGGSSVVKYKITATPGGHPSQQKEPVRVNGQEVRFFTPVRRSVRIERTSLRYPASLQDHDLCVASYKDLISEEDPERSDEQKGLESSPSANDTPMYVYRQNEALKDKVIVQLVQDDSF